MKNFKRFLAILIAMSLIFTLAACGKNKTESNVENNEEKVEEKDESKDLEGTTLKIVATSEDYKELFDDFTEDTGVKVEFLSMSSGEVLSRTKAEGGKPMGDVWFGGGIDAFMEAKEEGLLEQYKSPEADDVPEQYKDSDGYWMAKGLTIVGFMVNKDVLEEKGLEMPKSWEDLTDSSYKDEILMSNPAISGTNYAAVNGLLQLMGEEEGWDFFEKLNENIPYYTERGSDPLLKSVEGEVAIGIIPVDKNAIDLEEEKNVEAVFPEDGIPWVPEGMAIFKNCDNLDGAKAFVDWILLPENQKKLAEIDGKDPAMLVKPGVEGYDFGVPSDKFIDEDLSSFGADREAILKKWTEMVGDK
jgi:iron(III) transport system substrate-binding protein